MSRLAAQCAVEEHIECTFDGAPIISLSRLQVAPVHKGINFTFENLQGEASQALPTALAVPAHSLRRARDRERRPLIVRHRRTPSRDRSATTTNREGLALVLVAKLRVTAV